MDMFEQAGFEHRFHGILSAWGSFKVELLRLIDSYDKFDPIGQLHKADVKNPNDNSIVIVCDRGTHPKKQLNSLMITIRAEMAPEQKLTVNCEIEQWCKPLAGSASREWGKSMIFALAEDNTSLIFAKQSFTPAEAAAKLLETGLLRK